MENSNFPGKKPAATERPNPQPANGATINPRDWLTVKEAAHCLHVSRRTVVRMCETIDRKTGRSFLRLWRPTPGIVMICRRSLQQFCQSTQDDPDFWERRKHKTLSATAVLKPLRGARRKAGG